MTSPRLSTQVVGARALIAFVVVIKGQPNITHLTIFKSLYHKSLLTTNKMSDRIQKK